MVTPYLSTGQIVSKKILRKDKYCQKSLKKNIEKGKYLQKL